MIHSLRGVLQRTSADFVVVDVGGVGYGVRAPLSTLWELERREGGLELGSPIELLIHTQVREDAIELFGFLTELELRLFELLVSVSGIGPRLAQVILSGLAPREVATALAGGDVPRLVRIPGIGKKTAERMVLELRDKVTAHFAEELAADRVATPRTATASLEADAVSALCSLGYRPKEAERAVAAVRSDQRATEGQEETRATEGQEGTRATEGQEGTGSTDLSLQELLRSALRRLSKV